MGWDANAFIEKKEKKKRGRESKNWIGDQFGPINGAIENVSVDLESFSRYVVFSFISFLSL